MGKVTLDQGALRQYSTSPEVLRAVKEQIGDEILADAERDAPVRTGELRDSGYCEIEGDHVEVGFSADHAEFVELGTEKMRAQPFLRPNAVKNRGVVRL